MRRREFIAGLGTAAVSSPVWPFVARAQQPPPVIGFLHPGSIEPNRELLAAFYKGLADTGFVEGRNLNINYRWAEGRNDRLPAMAADLVRRPVNVIVTGSTPAALAAKAATATLPIVFQVGTDPVELGLVASLNRPGGNLTGVAELNTQVAAKCLEAIHELVPAATLVGLLTNPANPANKTIVREAEIAARILGVDLSILNAGSQGEVETAFATLLRQRAGALVVSADPYFSGHRDELAALAADHRLPAIFFDRVHVAAGGLMSYGTSLRDSLRQVGVFTGRILKGDRPAELPVQQATKIELVLNMKTAKALGLAFPTALLVRADEVIE